MLFLLCVAWAGAELAAQTPAENTQPAAVTITVKDELSGKPLEGVAAVFREITPASRAEPIKATTDNAGQAVLKLTPGKQYRFSFHKYGYILPHARTLTSADSLAVELTLKALAVLAGIVVDDKGSPLADAIVSVTYDRAAVRTNERGEFEIPFHPTLHWPFRQEVSRNNLLLVRHVRRNLIAVAEIPAAVQSDSIRRYMYKEVIAATQGAELDGRVLDSRGKPVADADVEVQSERAEMKLPLYCSARTGADGTFLLPALPVGWKYEVQISRKKYGLASVKTDQTAPGRQPLGNIVLEDANLSISGKVVDAAGTPVPNVQLGLFSINGICPLQMDMTTTDAQGGFRFDDLPKGNVELLISLPDKPGQSQTVKADAGRDDVVVRLE